MATPKTRPKDSGFIGSSKANAMARDTIARYVSVLAMFASRSRMASSSLIGNDIDWDSFEFKDEYLALKAAGYITGELAKTINHPKFPKDSEVIFAPSITVSGVSKLAELSEYILKTSTLGKVLENVVKVIWVAIGVIIGALGSLYLTP